MAPMSGEPRKWQMKPRAQNPTMGVAIATLLLSITERNFGIEWNVDEVGAVVVLVSGVLGWLAND